MFTDRAGLRVASLLFAATVIASAASGCESEVNPGEPSCEGYDNVEPAASAAVTWRFVNATDVPLYLDPATSCSLVEAGFHLFDSTGTELQLDGGSCGGSCQSLQDQGYVVCDAACALPPVQLLAPGATFEHVWDGAFWQSKKMPEECVAGSSSFPQSEPADEPADPDQVANEVECQQKQLAADGTYELRQKAFTVCSQGAEVCACDGPPDADGSCRVADSFSVELGGEMIDGKVSFSVPAPGVIELRYEGMFAQGE